MRKTMVYIEDDQFLLLKRTAETSKKKMSEIIRAALSSYLKKTKKKPDYFSFVGIAKGPKKGRASEQVDKILRETLK